MLATPGDLPVGPDWVYEVEWDGLRVLAEVADGQLRLVTLDDHDVTACFPELAGLTHVVPDVVLDGTLVLLTAGAPDAAALGERLRGGPPEPPATLMLSDVLRLYGVPLLERPFDERRSTLERLDLGGPVDGVPWQVPAVFEDGAALAAATRAQGLEGLVSKRRSSKYLPGRRSRDWVKRAHRTSQTCVIGGWRPQIGTAATPGSLLVGLPDDEGGLVFMGRVGSGIGPTTAQDLTRLLTPLARAASPFRDPLPRADATGARWVEPRVLVEVAHLGHGGQGRLRQPSVKGIRTDLRPEDVRREP
jgi:bifunctional non-homologous end joining protein LigD